MDDNEKHKNSPGKKVHAIIPLTEEVEIGKIMV
jgi:hypothetical protein